MSIYSRQMGVASKNLIRFVGRFLLSILGFLAAIGPAEIVSRRRSIWYSLDLREVIDFQTFFRCWEPETYRFIESFCTDGSIVVEVGANFGIHTLFIADRVGPRGTVFAFEPTMYASRKLLRNLELNPGLGPRVKFSQRAIGETCAVSNVAIRSSWNSHGSGQRHPDQHFDRLDIMSLDDFFVDAVQRIDVLKIDTDGYDWKVLAGAGKLISRDRPVIYIELSIDALHKNGDSVEKVWDFLAEQEYRCHDAHDRDFASIRVDVEEVMEELKGVSHRNYVFVPKWVEHSLEIGPRGRIRNQVGRSAC